MKAKIYKNGDIGLRIGKSCDHCGRSFWEITSITENKIILECNGCDMAIRITVKIDDIKAERIAREIVNEIKDEIGLTFSY